MRGTHLAVRDEVAIQELLHLAANIAVFGKVQLHKTREELHREKEKAEHVPWCHRDGMTMKRKTRKWKWRRRTRRDEHVKKRTQRECENTDSVKYELPRS